MPSYPILTSGLLFCAFSADNPSYPGRLTVSLVSCGMRQGEVTRQWD